MDTEIIETVESKSGKAIQGTAPAKLSIVVVDTEEGFRALEEDWNILISHADVTIFQTFEWLHLWWKYYGNKGRLHCLVFKLEDRIVGIAPLFKLDVKIFGIRIATHLQFVGRGLSDYVDIIVLPEYEIMVLDALVQHLRVEATAWDVFDCEDVNERSPIVKLFPEVATRHSIKSYRYQGNVCPRITLPTKEEVTENKKGPTSSYNFKRKFKKLQEHFNATVERYRYESDDLRKGIEMFFDLHSRRWKSLGHISAFDEESHRAFHVEVAERFARRDWLRLYFLNVNNVPLSVCFDFNFNDTIYMYQSNAHGTDELMKSSPGFLVRTIAMEEGIAEGMRIFDFLRGNEPYKYTEGEATENKNWLIRCSSPIPAGKLRFTFFLVYELIRKSFFRVRFEYYEFRRFTIAKTPTFWNVIQYLGSKLFLLFRLGFDFIKRHSSAGDINKNEHKNVSIETDMNQGAEVEVNVEKIKYQRETTEQNNSVC